MVLVIILTISLQPVGSIISFSSWKLLSKLLLPLLLCWLVKSVMEWPLQLSDIFRISSTLDGVFNFLFRTKNSLVHLGTSVGYSMLHSHFSDFSQWGQNKLISLLYNISRIVQHWLGCSTDLPYESSPIFDLLSKAQRQAKQPP